MPTAQNVADYFLAKSEADEDSLTHLKLQKLVYYAQSLYLALFDSPLFQEDMEAWEHGPVCVELYHIYKHLGKERIPSTYTLEEASAPFSGEAKELLDEVYDAFGRFSAWMLREISHQESAWQESYPNCLITHEAMKRSGRERLEPCPSKTGP